MMGFNIRMKEMAAKAKDPKYQINKEKIEDKISDFGRDIDKGVRESAKKHNLPAWKVWVYLFGMAVLVGLGLYLIL